MKRRYVLLAFALAAVVTVVLYVRRAEPTISVTTAPAITTRPLSAEPTMPPPAVATGASLKVAAPQSSDMARRLSRSTNDWQFVRDALNDLPHGGAAYAIQALNDCAWAKRVLENKRQSRKPPPANTGILMAQVEARALLEARCGPVTESGEDLYARLSQQGLVGSDPILSYLSEMKDLKAEPARETVLARLFELNDPLAWGLLGPYLANVDMKSYTAYFDGQTYAREQAQELIAAMQLVPCGMGYDCGSKDIAVAIHCLVSEVCEHDRFDLARAQAQQANLRYERIMDFYGRIVQAAEQKRIAPFVKP